MSEQKLHKKTCVVCAVEYETPYPRSITCGKRKCKLERVNQKNNERRRDNISAGLCRDCGKRAVEGKSKCHGCLNRDAARRRLKFVANPAFYMFCNARERSRSSGVPFELELEDIKVPEACPIMGIRLVHGNKFIQDSSPTLDKIVPTGGYVKGNVIVMSRRANMLKSNATLEEMVKLGEWAKEQICLREQLTQKHLSS